MSRQVLLAIENAVATITLNRPEVMNAMDGEMMLALREVTERVQDDESVRAVLLRGEGPAFLAGGDVAMLHAHLAQLPEMIVRVGREMHFAFLALRRMGKPVVASVHGAVAGAGVSLMAAADLAIAAHDTKFTLAYSRIGTSPDGGATNFLPRLVGYKKAMEMALLSDIFDAETARALGLVNWVVPAEQLAAETAKIMRRLAGGPTFAYARTKALINQSFDTCLEAQLEAELQGFARCARTADLAEGLAAFLEKRKPVFTGK